jgi:hypothetical protein
MCSEDKACSSETSMTALAEAVWKLSRSQPEHFPSLKSEDSCSVSCCFQNMAEWQLDHRDKRQSVVWKSTWRRCRLSP